MSYMGFFRFSFVLALLSIPTGLFAEQPKGKRIVPQPYKPQRYEAHIEGMRGPIRFEQDGSSGTLRSSNHGHYASPGRYNRQTKKIEPDTSKQGFYGSRVEFSQRPDANGNYLMVVKDYWGRETGRYSMPPGSIRRAP